VGVSRKRRGHIGSIKPVDTPIPHRINQVIIKILNFATPAKLNPTATKSIGIITTGLGFQMKEVAKKREGRRNFKESFTKMNKDRNMEDNIRSEMVQSNVKIIKKTMEESRSREVESSTNKGHKENNLTRT
jgi:hypothetical protein